MIDQFVFCVALSTDNPKEPERIFFVANSVAEVFGVVAKDDEYSKRFVSIDVAFPCKSI